jgi:hypothetical protein
MDIDVTRGSAEKLLTFKAIASALGLPYFKIQRAAHAKLFPTYQFLNGRRLARLSEVIAVIDRSRMSGPATVRRALRPVDGQFSSMPPFRLQGPTPGC